MFKRMDKDFIFDMLSACENILEYTQGFTYEEFKNNKIVVDAVIRNIEILGEAAKKVSDELKEKYNTVKWRDISRTRDKIIHFYFGVSVSIIWDIVSIDIPALKEKLEAIVKLENWEE
ncbi:MAG: DUF86 domain-containing protein [Epsilonproteobacteria bacterium]|nr:MAG: DUF86 domain-containing protein [Campylobacterota bacterium]